MVMQKILCIENLPYTCFLFSWKSKNSDHQVQVKMHNFVCFNKCGIGPDKHTHQ